MSNARYIPYQKPIPVEEAEKRRKKEAEHLLDRIAALQKEFVSLVSSELPTTEPAMREVYPGDEGYEDAPYTFNHFEYAGDFKWINQPVTETK